MVIAPQDADVRTLPAGAVPIRPTAMILHVQSTGGILVAGDLMDALPKLRKRVRHESSPDSFVGCGERFASVLAQVVASRGNAQVDAMPVPDSAQ